MTTKTEMKPESVQQSSDYSKFKFLPGNRKIIMSQVSHIKKSIQNNNLTTVRPIIVNEGMYIIDGQHTYLACKELGYPISYLVRVGGTIADVQSLNSSTRNWAGEDYLYMYTQRKNKNYIMLNEFMDRWRFNLWDSIRLLMNQASTGINGQQFRNGDFVVANYEKANNWAELIYEFSPYTDHFRKRSFVLACIKIFKLRGYKHKQMMTKLGELRQKIPTQPDQTGYLKEFDRIYNTGEKIKYSLFLEVKG